MEKSAKETPALLFIDMDAICHDFKAVILEDGTAAFSETAHRQALGLHRKNPLYPLLRVAPSKDLAAELATQYIMGDKLVHFSDREMGSNGTKFRKQPSQPST